MEILPTYIPQMVDQMVTERAMAFEAERLGLQVSDADVADSIRSEERRVGKEGRSRWCLSDWSSDVCSSDLIPQMVDQMVTERAMAFEAERLGLQVSDADVADSIRQMVPSLFPDGKFVGKDAYAGMLAQQNMTIDQFESDLKRQVMITRL